MNIPAVLEALSQERLTRGERELVADVQTALEDIGAVPQFLETDLLILARDYGVDNS